MQSLITLNEVQLCSFVLCLSKGRSKDDAVPLHMMIDEDKDNIVFNSLSREGEWGKAEKKRYRLKEGDAVDIRIRAHDDHFQAGEGDWRAVSQRNDRVATIVDLR